MTGFVFSRQYLDHNTGPGHPERAARLEAIEGRMKETGLWERVRHIDPLPASLESIELVHPREHIDSISAACRAGLGHLDVDTPISIDSFEVALLSAGGVMTACDAVIDGECRNAFCAVRPPGHHAERSIAMGFCLFNNVAVAARHLQRVHGVERVAIVDWDVHHGNGTQHIFEEDATVFYASIHQFPLYPGTGRASERGRGAGEGTTLNIPLPARSGDKEFIDALAQIADAIRRFDPGFLIVSAGYDAHHDDPLAGMLVTTEGFGTMTRMMLELADEVCDGRIVLALEGGYDLDALADGVVTSVETCNLGS